MHHKTTWLGLQPPTLTSLPILTLSFFVFVDNLQFYFFVQQTICMRVTIYIYIYIYIYIEGHANENESDPIYVTLYIYRVTFMGNEKSCQNINCFFSFPIKIFFNWILNECPKGTH